MPQLERILFLTLFVILLVLIASCQSTQGFYGPVNNRSSMRFSVEGVEYVGSATLPRRSVSRIVFYVPSDTEYIRLDSCSRDQILLDIQNGKASYDYKPFLYLENVRSCIMIAHAVTETGRVISAILHWVNGGTKKATVYCNGQKHEPTTWGFCQHRAAKPMWVQFDGPVQWGAAPGCAPVEKVKMFGSHYYEIRLSEGFCAYEFGNNTREVFKLTTFGYTSMREFEQEVEDDE